LQDDSNLSKPENANINRAYTVLSKNSKIWSNIS
jgi:ATP-dependent DNA helicase RecG